MLTGPINQHSADISQDEAKKRSYKPIWRAFCVSAVCCRFLSKHSRQYRKDGTFYHAVLYKSKVHKQDFDKQPIGKTPCPDCNEQMILKKVTHSKPKKSNV